MRPALLVGVAMIGGAAWWWWQQSANEAESADGGDMTADSLSSVSDEILSVVDDVFNAVIPVRAIMWSPDLIPAAYRAVISQTEAANGIPDNMLARLLYQESRYRPEIINGTKKSPVGALGIAQFMPATAAEMGIDPLDPMQAIPAAGAYLARLYRSTGSWVLALAAYNWGIGNVKRKGIDAAPKETRNYYSQILADLGMEGVTSA
ncbi:MAG: lytic transglycosylase domain-containing protein [Rhodocyclaceae bacterium]|nr:lytic transglycosylase domain-containing protein [Rhodocyclaceae bacterium]